MFFNELKLPLPLSLLPFTERSSPAKSEAVNTDFYLIFMIWQQLEPPLMAPVHLLIQGVRLWAHLGNHKAPTYILRVIT